jgi:hypothetical protein
MVATIEVQTNKFLSREEREFKQIVLEASTANIGDIEEAICQTNRKLGKVLSKDVRSQRIKTLENILQWLGLLANFEPFFEEYEGYKASFKGTDRGVTIYITTPTGETFQEKTESPARSSLIRHFKLWVNKRLPKLELLEGVAQEKISPTEAQVEIVEPVLSEKDLRDKALADLVEGCSVQCRKSDRIGIYKGIQDTPMPYAWVTFEKTYPEPTNPLDLFKVPKWQKGSRVFWYHPEETLRCGTVEGVKGQCTYINFDDGTNGGYSGNIFSIEEDDHLLTEIVTNQVISLGLKIGDTVLLANGACEGTAGIIVNIVPGAVYEPPFVSPQLWLRLDGSNVTNYRVSVDEVKKVLLEDTISRILAGDITDIPSPLIKDICGENNWIELHTGHSLSSEIYQPTWKLCSHIADSLRESEDSRKESNSLVEESKLFCSSKMIGMRSQSCEATTQISQSTPTSEIGVPTQESLTSTRLAFPVREHPLPEVEPDSNTKSQNCGSKHLDVSASEDQNSSSWNNLKDLSLADFEQCLEDCEWHNIRAGISNSYRERKSVAPKNETGYLLLPTVTSLSSKKSRAAGQTRLEKFFRDNSMLQDSQCLSGEIMESIMGFPTNHTKCLSECQGEKQGGLEGDLSLVGQLFPSARQSPLNGSSISPISPDCFKIPNDLEGNNLTKDEVYGLIKQVNGVVETAPEFLKYSKNFIRYALVKIDNRRGYEDFDYKNMTEFLAERCNLFSKGYSTLQKEWQAGKLEYSLGFEIGTLPETQAREMYPLKDKIDECEQAYALACSWAQSENRKVRTGDIRLAVRNLLNISTIEPVKTKCGWVAGPNAARHYRVRILEAEINLHDAYTEAAQELETMVKAEQTPPEQLLIEGLLGAFAQSLGTSHAGAIAAAVEFLKSKNIPAAVA